MILRNPPGRSEAFVEIEIHVSLDEVDFDPTSLDRIGRREFIKATRGRSYLALKGIATIAWKDPSARDACITDHMTTDRRKGRWSQVEQSAGRMRNDEFPTHGHVYVIDSSADKPDAMVIDGTRRMLAYLEAGHSEMPVIALVIQKGKEGREGTQSTGHA